METINHQKLLQKAAAAVERGRARCAAAKWRPVYHVAAPVGWINDPNGWSYYGGAYHLFYQYHPYSAQWGPMHWGHAVSRDLAHWDELPIALAPGESYDRDGCFSGSALEKDGRMYLIYTGHVDLPTVQAGDIDRIETQCMAVSEDGVHFEKLEENPVIAAAPPGDIHPGHFRDPKMWMHGDRCYCVVGSQTKSEHGQALLFVSEDMVHWRFLNVMATSDGSVGFMWECPSFAQIGDSDVLICSPQGMRPEGKKFLNLHQSGYMLGRLDYESGVFTHGAFELLDYGFDFYAPQTMTAPDGRVLMIAWMDMWESEMPEQEDGWAGMMTVPRVLTVKDGKVYALPAEELKARRSAHIVRREIAVSQPQRLEGVAGDCYEMEVVFDMAAADGICLKLRASDAEETALSYDKASGILRLDRDRSGKGPRGVREVPVALENGCLKLRIYMDRSSVEIFVNDGAATLTARIYPAAQSVGVIFQAEGMAMLKKLDFYTLQ